MDIQTRAYNEADTAQAVGSITVGIDGRLYCHDITPELLSVLAAICGEDAELLIRKTTTATKDASHA